MKTAIHPTYHKTATVVCACGNTFTVGSTLADIRIELCDKCHPFYTGQQKLIDTSRRIEKFAEKTQAKAAKAGLVQGKKAKAVKRASQKAAKKANTSVLNA